MNKKLKLKELKIRSFITIEADNSLQTLKAGAIGSDGPPHTSTAGSGHLPYCSAQCPTQNCDNTLILDCGSGGSNPNQSSACGTGGSGTTTQMTQ